MHAALEGSKRSSLGVHLGGGEQVPAPVPNDHDQDVDHDNHRYGDEHNANRDVRHHHIDCDWDYHDDCFDNDKDDRHGDVGHYINLYDYTRLPCRHLR